MMFFNPQIGGFVTRKVAEFQEKRRSTKSTETGEKGEIENLNEDVEGEEGGRDKDSRREALPPQAHQAVLLPLREIPYYWPTSFWLVVITPP